MISFLSVLAANVLGCTCLPGPTVLDAFESYENVLTAEFLGVERIPNDEKSSGSHELYAGVLKVENVYKGSLREGELIRVFNGGGGDCSGGFYYVEKGDKFLFYMGNKRSVMSLPVKMYVYGICSRSGLLKNRKKDLNFLDNHAALAGKTRLSASLIAGGGKDSTPSVSGIKVEITGRNIHREATTDADGFFEFWDLPPGNYSIKYFVPDGWKLGRYVTIPSDPFRRKQAAESTIPATIFPRKHGEIRVFFEIDNEISGRVLAPDGSPMKKACVSAFPTSPIGRAIPTDCSNGNGEFRLESLPEGTYRLEINSSNKLSAETPYKKFYYPGTYLADEAELLQVGPGLSVRGLTVQIPRLIPLINLSGRVVFRDGSSAKDMQIKFVPKDKSRPNVTVKTDEDGNFGFELPQGTSGTIRAEANIFSTTLKECSEALKLRESQKEYQNRSSISEVVNGNESQIFRLTFPLNCK